MDDEPIRPLVPRPKGMLAPSLPTQALPSPSPTTPRSILKTSDSTLVARSESSASSPPSSPSKSITKRTVQPHDPGRITPARKVKEGAFFAFVLLPLSCWYTRGGKRLKEMEDFDDEPFRPRPSAQLQRRSSVSVTPSQQMQLQRRSSVGIAVPMQSPGGRW